MDRPSQTILLADDEDAITGNLGPFLKRSGYAVYTARDGQSAYQTAQRVHLDLIVSDVLMPVMDGRELLRRLRQGGNWTPVILLTQVGEATERALALEEGADDYLNKPFDPHELLARIRAVLRRSRPGQRPLTSAWKLYTGISPEQPDLMIDRQARKAYLKDQPAVLTPKAFALLEYMMTHPDELLRRERLLDVVWGWDYPAGTRTVDTRIAELRRVLGDDPLHPRFIESLPGEGYRFIANVQGMP